MNESPRTIFFDGIAEKWDAWEDLPALMGKLASGLEDLGIGSGEAVLDVGCGTGNLTMALLAKLSASGRIVAIDISSRMIEIARKKAGDPRVEWHTADARRLPLEEGTIDRAICCSVWPHFEDRRAVAKELYRVLRPGGCLHVWHLASREHINEVHASAGEAVQHDMLPPAAETSDLLARSGFLVTTTVDGEERYLVTALKPTR